jgi:hypothetical protein
VRIATRSGGLRDECLNEVCQPAMPANPGVNLSLTIAALAEHAMAQIPDVQMPHLCEGCHAYALRLLCALWVYRQVKMGTNVCNFG